MLEDLRLFPVTFSLFWTGHSAALIAQILMSSPESKVSCGPSSFEPNIWIALVAGFALVVIGRGAVSWNERVKCRDATRREI